MNTLAHPQTTITPAAAHEIAAPRIPNDNHPVAVYLSSLQSPLSRATMREVLHNLAKLMSKGTRDEWSYPWEELRFQHVNALKSMLLETQSYVTVNKKLSAVKGVLKAAWRLELIDSETYYRTVDVKSAKGETIPKGRSVAAGEMYALFSVCAADRELNPAAAARDAALFAVMYSVAGPRRSEIVALDFEDYDADDGRLVIRSGKGNKARTNYLGEENRAALNDWIALRGSMPGPLFCPVVKSGRIVREDGTPARMTNRAINKIMTKRAQQAGLKAVTPHDMRRTVAGDLLDRGEDVVTVKQLLGHSSIATTERYDRRGEKRKARAAKLLHVPYSSE